MGRTFQLKLSNTDAESEDVNEGPFKKSKAEEEAVENRWQNKQSLFWSGSPTREALPAGLYKTTEVQGIGVCLDKIDVATDELLVLPNAPSNEVLDEIKTFWTLEEQFVERGFIHKRGVLLWGPPGSGKTSTIAQLIELVIKQHGGIGIFCQGPNMAAQALHMVRSVEKSRPIIVLMEDLDALVDSYGENDYLALLDGETQIANVVFVATTNYPERLDRRFVDRPSRFDCIKYIGMPSNEARGMYLKTKEPSLTDEEIAYWVSRSDGFSIAHLRELIILVKCYGKTIDEAINRLEDMRESTPKSSDQDDGVKKGIGFLAQTKKRG